jgi:outer membrane protein OmpA-like peptidoglycan-associated protein
MHLTGLVLVLGTAAGCATVLPPQELVTARTVSDRAMHGPAAQLDPTDLHTAADSLAKAEASFDKTGDTQETRDDAYTAERRFEIAESRARTLGQIAQKDQTVAGMNAAQGQQVRSTAAALGAANQALASTGQQLQNERQRREDAEKRAAQAAADLARLGSVRQEARGIVMTLSGGVLFVSAKSDLLPSAQQKLNDIADALTKTDPDSKIIVEGFTDSQGSAASNQTLSQARAQSVRDYLVAHGVASDRVTAQGFGPGNPVADNTSAEGRANNRRVEIVIQPAGAQASL